MTCTGNANGISCVVHDVVLVVRVFVRVRVRVVCVVVALVVRAVLVVSVIRVVRVVSVVLVVGVVSVVRAVLVVHAVGVVCIVRGASGLLSGRIFFTASGNLWRSLLLSHQMVTSLLDFSILNPRGLAVV